MKLKLIAVFCLGSTFAWTLSGCSDKSTGPTSSSDSSFSAAAKPLPSEVDPEDFVSGVTNPHFPLVPGTKFFYAGTKEGATTTDQVFVMHVTKLIQGVECTQVQDLAFEDSVLVERTLDWYAQDEEGNVWYFGEATEELDSTGQVVSTEGSWEAGVDGASPGRIMLAKPKVGARYHQELAPEVAMDMAQVRRLDESLCVPLDCYEGVLVTKEWNLLEKGSVNLKSYAPGVGLIQEVGIKGGDELSSLDSITTGN